ncbi:MAG: hypothetical protein KUG81_03175 [Gammaproteobacteria bacterium]|nr:hypothetical protein [Gammaproteobacteria bacterium]
MQNDPRVFLIMAASFVVTVFLFTLIVRRSKPERKIIWIAVCSIFTLVWLGVVKGPVAVLISIMLSSGYITTRLDGRRIGKKVAHSFNIKPNLFFTSLEQSLPMYLHTLALMEREGLGVDEVKEMTAPFVLQGLDALESSFGQQDLIEDTRRKVSNYIVTEEIENV